MSEIFFTVKLFFLIFILRLASETFRKLHLLLD
ncbi:hypothetical protein T07_4630 [Trichinella nelsoni]|uniref:Uncharacterized protein n=1 Tax=Trichinella nelsoni TaxID=6336 RepID=A0A0V0RB16_9BILA|nr:hypothetical protein T07_4630 [Trichinella nelsoni]